MKDKQAIRRLKQGHIDGLEFLVRQYQTKALHIGYLITQDVLLAEDIVQTAFLRVHERIHQFDDQRPFSPWFFRLVSNDAIKAAQGQTRLVTLDTELENLPHDVRGLPEHLLEQAETKEQLVRLLEQLSPEQRAVIVLRFYAGLRHAEIADQLGVPSPTVRWRLYAALRHLRHLITKASSVKRGVIL